MHDRRCPQQARDPGLARRSRAVRTGLDLEDAVAAVETSDDGHPRRLLLHVVKTHDGENIKAMARAHLSPTARVVSDGLGCFRSVTRIGCGHEPMIAAQLGWSERLPCFRWVNTVLGNIKTAIVSTLKSVNKRYVFRYFGEFQYRFNRRFNLPELLDRLAYVVTRSAPRPRRLLAVADHPG